MTSPHGRERGAEDDDRGRAVRHRHRRPIPGVTVAGKTGTAELRDTVSGSGPQDTDAWFVGYAPAGAPRIVVGALFPANGAGGATAAPAVHDVLVAGLQSH